MNQDIDAGKGDLGIKIEEIAIKFWSDFNKEDFFSSANNYVFPEHPSLLMQKLYHKYCSSTAQSKVQKEIVNFINAKIDNIKGNGMESKSLRMSALQRKLADDMFLKQKDFSRALEYYTKAALYAPKVEVVTPDTDPNGSNLALAYANRSAVFFELGQWSNALMDIEYALEAGYKDIETLLLRKIEALTNLEKIDEAKKVLDDDYLKDSTSVEAALDRIECLAKDLKISTNPAPSPSPNERFTLTDIITAFSNSCQFKPSPVLPSFSAKLEVKIDPEKGRCLVAREPVARGETLYLEMPYTSALQDKLELKHCHHCANPLQVDKYKLSTAESTKFLGSKKENAELCEGKPLYIKPAIPCSTCSTVLFCSKTCREAAWTAYHRFECGIVSLLQEYEAFLPLRMLFAIKGGLQTAKTVIEAADQACQRKELFLPEAPDTNSTDKSSFLCGSYSAVYQMRQRRVMIHPGDHVDEFRLVVMAEALLAIVLRLGFFAEPLSAEDLHLTRCLLLRHILQISVSIMAKSFRLEDLSDLTGDPLKYTTKVVCPNGQLLLKHSCAPNLMRRNVTCASEGGSLCNLLLFGQATRAIKVGEEVRMCMIGDNHYTQMHVGERQKNLGSFFDCTCQRCQFELAEGLDGMYLPFSCDRCRSLLVKKVDSDTSTVSFACTACTASLPLKTISERYANFQAISKSISETLDVSHRNPLKNIQDTEKALDKLQSMLFVNGYESGHIPQQFALQFTGLTIYYCHYSLSDANRLVERMLPSLEKAAAVDGFDIFDHHYYMFPLVNMMWNTVKKLLEEKEEAKVKPLSGKKKKEMIAILRQWPRRVDRLLALMDFFAIQISLGPFSITSNDLFYLKTQQFKEIKVEIEEGLKKK